MRRSKFQLFALAVALVCLNASGVLSEDCGKMEGITNERLICLEKKIEELMDQTVPPKAVIAFNLPACPTGWQSYEKGAGRVIIGAGIGNKDQNNVALTKRSLESEGGEEGHTLVRAELPAVSPKFLFQKKGEWTAIDSRLSSVIPCIGNGCNNKAAFTNGARKGENSNVPMKLEELGEGKRMNIMPPFIALTLCEKQ